VEHELFEKMIKKLRPDAILPTRQALAGKLLDNAYAKSVRAVTKALDDVGNKL
jgi:hypothetical protein